MKKLNLMTLVAVFSASSLCGYASDDVMIEAKDSLSNLTVEKRLELSKEYDHIGKFSEGLACVWLNGKGGYMDKSGNLGVSGVLDIPLFWIVFI